MNRFEFAALMLLFCVSVIICYTYIFLSGQSHRLLLFVLSRCFLSINDMRPTIWLTFDVCLCLIQYMAFLSLSPSFNARHYVSHCISSASGKSR